MTSDNPEDVFCNRKPNWTFSAQMTLLELYKSNSEVLRPQKCKTDPLQNNGSKAKVAETKATVWKKITDELNSRHKDMQRSVTDVKRKCTNLVQIARRELQDIFECLNSTDSGPGPLPKRLTIISQRALEAYDLLPDMPPELLNNIKKEPSSPTPLSDTEKVSHSNSNQLEQLSGSSVTMTKPSVAVSTPGRPILPGPKAVVTSPNAPVMPGGVSFIPIRPKPPSGTSVQTPPVSVAHPIVIAPTSVGTSSHMAGVKTHYSSAAISTGGLPASDELNQCVPSILASVKSYPLMNNSLKQKLVPESQIHPLIVTNVSNTASKTVISSSQPHVSSSKSQATHPSMGQSLSPASNISNIPAGLLHQSISGRVPYVLKNNKIYRADQLSTDITKDTSPVQANLPLVSPLTTCSGLQSGVIVPLMSSASANCLQTSSVVSASSLNLVPISGKCANVNMGPKSKRRKLLTGDGNKQNTKHCTESDILILQKEKLELEKDVLKLQKEKLSLEIIKLKNEMGNNKIKS